MFGMLVSANASDGGGTMGGMAANCWAGIGQEDIWPLGKQTTSFCHVARWSEAMKVEGRFCQRLRKRCDPRHWQGPTKTTQNHR